MFWTESSQKKVDLKKKAFTFVLGQKLLPIKDELLKITYPTNFMFLPPFPL